MFGLSTGVKSHLQFLDDTDVVYPAGHALVRLDTDTRVQRLIQGTLTSRGITAMATASSKKLTAFAEAVTDRHPVITVYDWPSKRRRKVINNIDAGSNVVLCMSFSGDGKYLILQCGAPNFELLYLHWEKAKVTAKLSAIGTMVRGCVHL